MAHIRLTSALDGAVQLLDARSIREWRHTSAYFNGDTVLVELISPPGAGPCRIDIDAALFDGESVEPRNTCDATDDRIPSNDARVARLLPIGCTGWLIRDANFNFLTAGHCAAGGGTSLAVAEFNVPFSNVGGLINHPPPSDQYAVDPASIQKASIVDIGNDWTHFGTFDNSTTGLTAYEAQGDAFALSPIAPTAGTIIRKTGCGTTDSTVPREWNQAQKTLAGPLNSFSGTTLSYRIDSSGGDSGSPVFDDSSQLAVAIHTNGGCTSTGGTNRGCSTLHPDLQTAIANPQGVCIPRFFDFAFPNGRPQWIDPLGGTELLVEVTGRNGHVPAAAGVWLWVDSGDGFESRQLESIGGSLFRGPFPPTVCAETLRYYVTASTETGNMTPEPLAAPAESFLTLAAQSVTTLASFDFETSAGWTVQNISVVSGAWERGIPAGDGTRGDPLFDFDGSGQCWLTGNAIGDSDVDGGPTGCGRHRSI
ncbi:MAG: hypothetical protein IPK83_15630 [Planctomycetes bacterium]|nr:hypothetical protein [Planctomycetota bacterium]